MEESFRWQIYNSTRVQPEILPDRCRFMVSQKGGIRNTLTVSDSEEELEHKEGKAIKGEIRSDSDDSSRISPVSSVANLGSNCWEL